MTIKWMIYTVNRRLSVWNSNRTVLLIPEKWLYCMLIDNIDLDRRPVIRGHHVEVSISVHLKQEHAINGEGIQFSITRFKERCCVVSLTHPIKQKHRCAAKRLQTGRALNVHGYPFPRSSRLTERQHL